MIEEEKLQNGQFFKFDLHSPLAWYQKESFDHLKYSLQDIKYRFDLELYGHSWKGTTAIEDTKGYLMGFFNQEKSRLSIDGVESTMQVSKSNPDAEEVFFVPFKDNLQ